MDVGRTGGKRKPALTSGARPFALTVICLILSAYSNSSAGLAREAPSLLEPASDAAARIERLWWVVFWISTVVVVLVVGLIIAAAVRRTGSPTGDEIDRSRVPWGERFIVVGGLWITGAILAATFLLSLWEMNALSSPPQDPRLSVEVVARNWWWEVRYPNGAVTANEIHIPVGEPVEVKLPSGDVIHSFWVPQLQVKKDHIPGMDNRLWLVADAPGRYRGQCAEYCGLQHANMVFYVVAQPRADFSAWLAREASPASAATTLGASRGRDIFLGSSCAGCHTIRGTTAVGDLGPDLTHLAARETIGAGLMPLTRENLRDFVANPQDDKPGVTMPPTELSGDELEAVVDYLMQLE